MKGEGTPLKRRRMTFLMLPDDLVFNCLARVSRLYYPTLSLVSKRFRSLVASTELYQMRNLLGRTESCFYVCLRLYRASYPLRWFTLCQRPHSSKKILVPIAPLNSPSALYSTAAVVGHNIYVIGGEINREVGSSSLMIMDCRSHKWGEAPSMRVARMFRFRFPFESACVVDGKIHVIGGCQNLDSTNWMEVFDTRTQTWEFLQIPSKEICGGGSEYKVVRYEGTLYVRSEEKDVGYKLHKGRWRMADLAMNYGWGDSSASYCVIDNVFYVYKFEKIKWYDSKQRLWATLKGLEILLPSLACSGHVKLTDYGGKMLLLWTVYCASRETKMTWWCAEITIEQRLNGEIWGMVEWFDVIDSAIINEPVGNHSFTVG